MVVSFQFTFQRTQTYTQTWPPRRYANGTETAGFRTGRYGAEVEVGTGTENDRFSVPAGTENGVFRTYPIWKVPAEVQTRVYHVNEAVYTQPMKRSSR